MIKAAFFVFMCVMCLVGQKLNPNSILLYNAILRRFAAQSGGVLEKNA